MPPLLKHDTDSRSSSSHSPPSLINATKQRRLNSLHLADIAVDFGFPPSSRRDKKDHKPRRFYTPHHSYFFYYQQHWKWWLLLLAVVFFTTFAVFSLTPLQEEPQRNQLLLYRIIGNDLPPRHKEGQTLSNLHFILEHEPSFPNTRKMFLLNRISDPASERAIIDLLERYHAEYLRIPFDEEEYKQIDFRLEDFSEPDFLHSDDYRRFSKVAKLRTLDYTYHDKNLYAMNNVSIFNQEDDERTYK